MKRLVEFPSESGHSIVVEVDESSTVGVTRRGLSPSAALERGQTTFEEAVERARPLASALIEKLRSISDPPDEVQVEFGLSLSAEAGAVLASASTSAHYRVTLTWERAAEPPPEA